MFGFRDVFQYLECDSCGCLQLVNGPEDLGRYYPPSYATFGRNGTNEPNRVLVRVREYVRKRRNRSYFEDASWLDRLLESQYEYPQLKSFAQIGATRGMAILDVGCGSGRLLLDLQKLGYKNLLGVDRYLPESTNYADGLKVVKAAFEDLAGAWDVIMFHHAFEHMSDPANVLRLTADRLAPGGRCLIRIPLVGWAWRHYGVDWVQLDAPRHLFLYTEKSFRLLAHREGLRVQKVRYDSTGFQFWGSELYRRDIPLRKLSIRRVKSLLGTGQMKDYERRALELNDQGLGDQAVFYLTRAADRG